MTMSGMYAHCHSIWVAGRAVGQPIGHQPNQGKHHAGRFVVVQPNHDGARAGSRTLNLGIKSQSTSCVMACHQCHCVSAESESMTQLYQERHLVSGRVTVKLSNKLSAGS